MDRLLEFIINHPFLVGTFFALLAAFITLEMRRGGKSVSPQQLTNLVNGGNTTILDVRDPKEYREGHITGAKNIPFTSLQSKVADVDKDKSKTIILVCKMGQHSSAAGRILTAAGYTDVRRLSGGVSSWQADGLPLVS